MVNTTPSLLREVEYSSISCWGGGGGAAVASAVGGGGRRAAVATAVDMRTSFKITCSYIVVYRPWNSPTVIHMYSSLWLEQYIIRSVGWRSQGLSTVPVIF